MHYFFRSRGVIILASICTLWAVSLPIAMPTMLDTIQATVIKPNSEQRSLTTGIAGSIEHRYYIWRFATENAQSKSLVGWGTDTSRRIPGGHTNIGNDREILPLHPHNALLQVWLELGYIGLLLLSVLIAFGLRHAVGDARAFGSLTASISVFFVVANLSFGLWQSWWLAAITLTLALAIAQAKQDAAR